MSPGVRKLVGLAFLVGLIALGGRVLLVESAECALQFQTDGRTPPEGAALRVELFEVGEAEAVGHFSAQRLDGPPLVWNLTLASGDYRVEGFIDMGTRSVSFRQELSLEDGTVAAVHLGRYLQSVSGAE